MPMAEEPHAHWLYITGLYGDLSLVLILSLLS